MGRAFHLTDSPSRLQPLLWAAALHLKFRRSLRSCLGAKHVSAPHDLPHTLLGVNWAEARPSRPFHAPPPELPSPHYVDPPLALRAASRENAVASGKNSVLHPHAEGSITCPRAGGEASSWPELPSPFHSLPWDRQSPRVTYPNPLGQQIPNTHAAFEQFGKKRNTTPVTPSIVHATAPIPLKIRASQEKETHSPKSHK